MGSIIVSIVIFIVAVFLFIQTTRKLNSIRSEVIIKEAREEMDALITEFNRAAARNIDLLEEKIQGVRDVMQKANEKMIRLDRKIEQAKQEAFTGKRMMVQVSEDDDSEIMSEKSPIDYTYEKHRVYQKIEEEKSHEKTSLTNKKNPKPTNHQQNNLSKKSKLDKTPNQKEKLEEKKSASPSQNNMDKIEVPKNSIKKKEIDVEKVIEKEEIAENYEKLSEEMIQDIEEIEAHRDKIHEIELESESRSPTQETQSTSKRKEITDNENRKEISQPKPIDQLPRSERLKEYIREGKTKEELLKMGFMENEINLLSFLIQKR